MVGVRRRMSLVGKVDGPWRVGGRSGISAGRYGNYSHFFPLLLLLHILFALRV